MKMVASFTKSNLLFGFNNSDITMKITIGGSYYVQGYEDVQLYDELEFITAFDVDYVNESFYGQVNYMQLVYDQEVYRMPIINKSSDS